MLQTHLCHSSLSKNIFPTTRIQFVQGLMAKTRQSTRASNLANPVVDNLERTGSKHNPDHEPPKKRFKLEMTSGRGLDPVSKDHECSKPNEKRKKKAKNAAVDTDDFLPRVDSPWKVGAHVSAAGGVENAVANAAAIGATAFALFLKSQRKWESPPLQDTSVTEFKKRMKEFGYSPRVVLPHGSYLINLGNPDIEKREKSYACFLDDLKRCEDLGLELYNFHPGSTVGQATLSTSIGHIAECINRAHKETSVVTVVLENMAGAGNIIGSEFSHLAGIIEQVEDKMRVGVCLDTCHAFAAGYDIRTQEGWNSTITKFDHQVGLKYLCGMHLNDSKTTYNSRRDRHENIGLGHLGLLAFQHILTDPCTQNIPLILETPNFEQPAAVWGKEIEVLHRISDSKRQTSPNSDSVLDVEALVQEVKDSVKSVEAKGNKASGKARKGGKASKTASKRKRKVKESDEDGEDEDGVGQEDA
ncbi:hypothetical protein GALMADRAFT_104145 [Galerina marginata CBS 339.88]|uniref:Apurinic-apyrimidinic endonuclease 1 n=1 Tax=Galerina marginata (strain CBS 339.88) TaxID=685588 RepID=A0A067SE71_GALM3|nr:hypothetical protein GALMADRAFT_104145 [Galerina marginata CBS 339.88]